MVTILLILAIGLVVGGVGAMMGIGGGILLIPILTAFLGVPIKTAIGTSIVCVIATSCAAGAVYVGRGMTHNRLAMILEVATTAGALAGGVTAVLISPRLLALLFACILIYVAFIMHRLPKEERPPVRTGALDTSYIDPRTGDRVAYGIRRLKMGMGASFLAGNVSGLLGIGGGIIKVPIMNLMMGVPLRAAIATSNFMIGITAATSGIIYYMSGFVSPKLAIPTALGVLAGAQIGTRVGGRIRSQRLRQIFQLLLLAFATMMLVQAWMK